MRRAADSSVLARTLRPGGHDLVLVAAAVAMGATWFLSLDRNSRQRSLAGAAGLRVWPPLDKDEKGLMRRATQEAAGRVHRSGACRTVHGKPAPDRGVELALPWA